MLPLHQDHSHQTVIHDPLAKDYFLHRDCSSVYLVGNCKLKYMCWFPICNNYGFIKKKIVKKKNIELSKKFLPAYRFNCCYIYGIERQNH